jgi:hypothetical protein
VKLFAIYIGGEHPSAHIEVHDVRFVLAKSMRDTHAKLRADRWGTPGTLHIDCWAEEQAAEPIPLLHPNLASLYRARIAQLCESLNDEEGMPRAAEVLRTLIDQIRLVPSAGKLVIDLRGDLAAILTFASDKKRPDVLSDAGLLGDLLSPETLVAGTGFEPVTFRL